MSHRDAVNGFGILIALRCVPFIMMTARHFFTAPHFHDVRLAHNIAQHSPARFADSSFQGTFASQEDVRGIPKWYSHGSGHQNWDMFLNLGDHIVWRCGRIYPFFPYSPNDHVLVDRFGTKKNWPMIMIPQRPTLPISTKWLHMHLRAGRMETKPWQKNDLRHTMIPKSKMEPQTWSNITNHDYLTSCDKLF